MPEPKLNREDHLNANEQDQTNLQDLTEHLDELRSCIIISIVAICVCIAITFSFSGEIIKTIEATAPSGSTFFQLKPGELFLSSLKVSVISGLVLALPVLLQQLYVFLAPGLEEREQKITASVFVMTPFFLYAGMAFSYFFILPPLLEFLLGFRTGVVESRYGLEHFLNLSSSLLVLTGIAFELPVLLFVLGLSGLVSSKMLLSAWRYVVMFAFITAAILTPTPDPFTMSILALALLALYFFSILVLKILRK